MATPLKRLGVYALNCTSRTPSRPRIPRRQVWQRPLSSSASRRADRDKPPDGEEEEVRGREKSEREQVNDAAEELGQEQKADVKDGRVQQSAADEVPDQSAADGFLWKFLGASPFRIGKGAEAGKKKSRGDDSTGIEYSAADKVAADFKYGEFGDEFDQLEPEQPEAQSAAYADAVRQLKKALESGAPDPEITGLLGQVQETQKALNLARSAWAGQFEEGVAEDIDETWEMTIAQIREEWEENQLELKQMEKDMLTRDPEDAGYWNMGEENEGIGEDEEFRNDDLTPLGHAELDQHRDIREYARLAAWEMPLLSKLAKPFVLPSAATPLRFRYTTYMGEQHPAARKVVIEFCPSDIPSLTAAQKAKLIKLAGVRYNPSTDRVKMSCENFEHAAQNKRYLSDVVDSLIVEAKDGKDTFEDVPFDFRHHKPKPKFEFPEHWKIPEGRQKELEEGRRAIAERESARIAEDRVLDGIKIIEAAAGAVPVSKHMSELVAVAAGKSGGRPRRQLT